MNRSHAGEVTSSGDPVLSCVVTSADIEAMLDAYDSGMCDLSTANCLSRALARALGSRAPLPLFRHGPRTAFWMIHGERVEVPPETLAWLESAEIGGQVGPCSFSVRIPARPDPVRRDVLLPMTVSLSR